MPARKRTARSPQPNNSESYRLPHPQCSHQVADFSEEVIIPTIIPSNSAPISVSPAVFRSRPVLPPVYNGSSTALDIDDDKTERLPTFSCSRLNSQFESGMIRLSNCCAATCNRICCRLPCVYSTHANSPNDSCSPLLSVPPAYRGSSVDVCGGNDTLETTVEQSELDRLNTEVVEWVRRRLIYFFMSPIEKFHAKRRIPYKLVVQFLKVFFITLQLIVFGMERSAHVSFGEDSRLTFSHLYLRDWDPQYETLDYPPAAGPYAVYEISDFYQNVGYVITQFNNTREIAIGAYTFNSRRPHMTLCQTDVDNAVSGLGSTEPQTKIQHCTKVYPMEIPAEWLSDPEGVERFLVSLNFTIDFSRLLAFNIWFRLLTPMLTELGWTHDPECFQFRVKISMEKLKQSGMLRINLDAPYTSTFCGEVEDKPISGVDQFVSENRSTWSPFERIQRFWLARENSVNDISVTPYNFAVRHILLIFLHSTTLFLGLTSLILCVRSVVKNFLMWQQTVLFFRHWFSINLYGHFWDFVHPWFLVIIVNDLMIISGSVYDLCTFDRLHHKPEPLSYVFGISALLVWSGILRYVGFSYTNSILMHTIVNSIPSLLRFGVCSLILFFAFSLCGWVVLGPYNLKFRTFVSTLECLFSLINGDDMFVTFSVIGERSAWGIFLFSRLFLYVFITLFIYVVLNLFITIIFEAYEEVKERRDTGGRSNHSVLFRFIANHSYSCRSPLFRQDDRRPDRHRLLQYALGRWTPTVTSNTSVDRSQFPASAGDDFDVTGSTLYRRCDLMQPEYQSSHSVRDSVPANPPVCNTTIAPTGSSSVSFISQTSGSGSSPNHVEHRPLSYAEEVEESRTLICSPTTSHDPNEVRAFQNDVARDSTEVHQF
ncbi:hypothetical protein P879_05867 [Paragonimus westermani]|uniref:Mucolipin 3 n=1 Tax=Paragonimus westermani TaxID=34504 RepID=A0A8T0DBD6_9TREM|nr:hypothetical protein P879_05867 [Paragonimus westermani]